MCLPTKQEVKAWSLNTLAHERAYIMEKLSKNPNSTVGVELENGNFERIPAQRYLNEWIIPAIDAKKANDNSQWNKRPEAVAA